MGLLKSAWKIASMVATIITIKNQLHALSTAPKEINDAIESLPGASEAFKETVVMPQTSSQISQMMTGL